MKKKQPKQRRIYFTLSDGMKREIYVSKFVDDATHKVFAQLVKALAQSKRYGTPVSSRDWKRINDLPLDLRDALSDKGLIEARYTKTVKVFLESLRDERTDLKENSVKCWNTAIKKLIAAFGNLALHEVTPEKAALFRADLVKYRRKNGEPFAEGYISKLIRLSRDFFEAARKRKLIDENPFRNVKTGSQVNEAKWHEITNEEYNGLFVGCGIEHDVQRVKAEKNSKAKKNLAFLLSPAKARLIIALGRSGLRIPSELLGLRRSEIDLEKSIFTVHSPKTERQGKAYRIVPIFDLEKPRIKLRQYFLDVLKEMPEGEDEIFPEIKPNSSNRMIKWFNRVAGCGGVVPWEEPFKNMRRTCASVLRDAFPEKSVNRWLGHTQEVAIKSYVVVRDEDIARAAGKSTSTEIVPSSKIVYQCNNQEFEPSFSEGFDFCDTAIVSAYRSSPEKNIYLYEALQKMGPAFAKLFTEERGDFNLDGLIDFCAENGFSLPKITANFTDFSSAESIVLYEILQYFGADCTKFLYEELCGDMTLENVCCFCATHGIPMPSVISKEARDNIELPEKLVENSCGERTKKAPILGLQNEENGRTWNRTKDLVVISDAL